MAWFPKRPASSGRPVEALSAAVSSASVRCANSLHRFIARASRDEHASKAKRLECMKEFYFFFSHYVSRTASQNHGAAHRAKIHAQLLPLVVDAAVEATGGHWPADVKARMRSEFLDGFKERDGQYAAFKDLWFDSDEKIISDDGRPMEPESVMNKLFANLAESVFERQVSVGLHRLVFKDIFAAIDELQLPQLIAAAAGVP